MPPKGAQPRPAQTRHKHVTAEQWQQFCEELDRWAQRYEPDPVLPVQAWSEATMEMLVRAVGPQACRTGAQVEAQEWGELMARKRRWQARAGVQEQQHVFLDRGPHDLPSARGMVRRRRGNVFSPIATLNDATGAPLMGAAMMREFARHMERKQGGPASVFPDPGARHTDLDFPMEAWLRVVQSQEPRAPGKSSMLTAAIK